MLDGLYCFWWNCLIQADRGTRTVSIALLPVSTFEVRACRSCTSTSRPTQKACNQQRRLKNHTLCFCSTSGDETTTRNLLRSTEIGIRIGIGIESVMDILDPSFLIDRSRVDCRWFSKVFLYLFIYLVIFVVFTCVAVVFACACAFALVFVVVVLPALLREKNSSQKTSQHTTLPTTTRLMVRRGGEGGKFTK